MNQNCPFVLGRIEGDRWKEEVSDLSWTFCVKKRGEEFVHGQRLGRV